jgi:hypothetical protein
MDVGGLQLLSDFGFENTSAHVFQQQAHEPIFLERESVKNHILAFVKRPQDADGGPETVNSLGDQR